jgi:hypothetical protein
MRDIVLGLGGAALLVVAMHLIAGFAIGTWFRFGALIPAFVVVLAESLVADFKFGVAPWYLLLIGGVVAVQLGYAAAGWFSPLRRGERRQVPPTFPASAPK